MKQPTKLAPGMMLGERYRIVRKIGEGGMSCVYLAEDYKLPGKQWAVKESVHHHGTLNRVQEEANLLINLNHPRLPGIIDFFEPDESGYAYLIMDYIEGQTLEQYLKQCQGRVSTDFILMIARQLLDVLGYLHSHTPPVVYRDLKPANIMLKPDHTVSLIDFGIARNYTGLKEEDTVKLGTVGFAAPEQYGGGESDCRSDLYGLGALLLYMLTNRRFSEWLPGVKSSIRESAPYPLIPVIRKLLEHRPEDRYASAAEVARVIQETLHPKRKDPVPAQIGSGFSGSLVTAVMGASAGLGVTHCCIMMGHYLAQKYNRVAIVEMGVQASAFKRIQEIASGSSGQHLRKFVIHGIDFWRQAARSDIISLLAGSYDAVVLDLGVYRDTERLEEFLRAHVPVIIAPSAEWRWRDVTVLQDRLSKHDQPGRMFAVPYGDEETSRSLSKRLQGSKVISLPALNDPFQFTDKSQLAMDQIYEGYIHGNIKKRWFRFRKI
ncbi:serine/threonine-protein kinase [Paenibacillus lemnae]|uniref:non-specific serine/threonine protein kinase n=1 Tax=Paenibacillus lemnae TaxID=1330551 RepID=A0A848M4U2_PAELE|nr:serine/threonine-protein kinase [Paenibacillus lemnae]NMO95957.1 serine/threonine protein kinase [Paenibacillus lemnae]